MKTLKCIDKCLVLAAVVCWGMAGCDYSDESLYPGQVSSVYVEMFDSASFRRGHEYVLTDALAKRIEAETPYKIISNRNRADTVLSGYITAVDETILADEQQTGLPLEKQFEITAVVSWKNLKTGELIIDSETASAAASFSEFQDQGTEYASRLAANRLAERIVEMMQKSW
jgi:hypothetical protein